MSDTLSDLTIFYTHQLHGDLALLPRLHTFLQQLKREYGPKPLLLDLGEACAADVWHCDLTNGRSTLVALDGLGYHAVNITGFLGEGQREQLQNTLSASMIDASHAWRYHVPPVRDEGILIAATEAPALRLCIVAAPADETKLEGRTLRLASVEKGQVGIIQLDLQTMTIALQTVVDLPPKLKPDATIVAAIEFIEDEARFFQRKRDDQGGA